MNKTIKKVFLVLALLVGIFLAWQLIFNDGGILRVGYNTLANNINNAWSAVGSGNLVTTWGDPGDSKSGAATNGNSSRIGIGEGENDEHTRN